MTLPSTLALPWPLLAGALLWLGGCDLGPDYARPALEMPAAFRATNVTAEQAWPAPEWWHGFGSPELDRLIADARLHNQNLAQAAARVLQANAQVSINGAPLLPAVNGAANRTYQKSGISGFGYRDTRITSGQASASYEADFWGRNRAFLDSAKATALGTRFDQETVALSVVSAVATTYFQALGASDRLAVARRNLAQAREILQVFRVRVQVGTGTALDVAQQEALVAGVSAQIPFLQSQIDQQVIGLGILVGHPPEAIAVSGTTLARLPVPVVAAGLPAELLARRPDVAFAEASIVAENGNVRAARAAFFPTVQLTAQGGVQSLALGGLFGPGSLLLAAAGSLVQPIFDNGLRQGNLDQAKARFTELVASYRQAVLQAFTDVDLALTTVRYTGEQEALERRAVNVAQRASDIARAQLAAGTVDITTVLNTQNTLFSDQDTLAQVRLTHFQAVINLYKAMGGGFQLPVVPPGTS